MSAIRFNVNDARWKTRLATLRTKVKAKAFEKPLRAFCRNVLNTCVTLTPERSFSVINRNQRKQYLNRINYIPSIQDQSDPMLIVDENGTHWLKCNGKWYNASGWRLPEEVSGVYGMLNQERERRMHVGELAFIGRRIQSRSLYKRSWLQAGDSINIPVNVSSDVRNSYSRHNPRKDPKRAYSQTRGGEQVLSIVVYNPFLQEESRYKPWTGKQIIDQSIARHEPEFFRSIGEELTKLCR